MKHFFALSLMCVAMAAQLETSATVWRVNNQGYSANYTDLQAAIDNSGAGDTIHIEPSSITYGYVEVDLPLTFIGPGYKLGQASSDNPGLQANAQMATVGRFVLAQFSEGTVIEGLRFNGAPEGILFTTGSGNYIIRRCFFDGVGMNFGLGSVVVTDVLITQCYLNSFALTTHATSSGQNNVTISNNFINGYIANFSTLANNWVIEHNVITWNITAQYFSAEVRYNVFDGLAAVPVNNNDIHDNIARNSNILPSGNNNQNSINLNLHYPSTGSDDGKWDLVPGSSYNNWFPDGTDVGMYGGQTRYIRSGIPAIPTIYELTAPATAIQGEQINVTLSTKSNN